MTFETIFRWIGITRFNQRVDPFKPIESAPPNKLWPFILWCLKGSYSMLIIGVLASCLAGTLDVAAAFILGRIIDVLATADAETVFADNALLLVGGVVFFLVARPLLFSVGSTVQSLILGPNLFPQINSRLHRWTLGQSVSFFDNDFAGRIAQKQMQTASALTDVVLDFINTVVFAVISAVAAMLILAAVDWRVSLILLFWICLYFPLFRYFMPKIRKYAKMRAGARATVTGQIVDTVTNMRTVKLFAHSAHEDQAATEALRSLRSAALEFGYVSVSFRGILLIVAGLLPVLLIGTTVYFWSIGSATIGQLTSVGAIALRLSQMINWVSFTVMGIYAKIGEVEDGMNTLTKSHVLVDAPDAQVLPRPLGDIKFDDVTFSYGRVGGGISNLTVSIAAGERVGVVGASGAGKSTLVSTLLRLYEPEQGRILVDGYDIGKVTQESLRSMISMVTQDTAMFNRSALDNIRYGRPDAPEADVVQALKQARAYDFVLGLRDLQGREGLAAHLGEKGVKLSGGQRQRIALARAILKDAPILVLDEATSALDSEVEAEIQAALTQVMQGKTVIAIAHRLSTIAQMDRILVMEAGNIIEQGTHQELLEQNGRYARFWNHQSGGFDSVEAAE